MRLSCSNQRRALRPTAGAAPAAALGFLNGGLCTHLQEEEENPNLPPNPQHFLRTSNFLQIISMEAIMSLTSTCASCRGAGLGGHSADPHLPCGLETLLLQQRPWTGQVRGSPGGPDRRGEAGPGTRWRCGPGEERPHSLPPR